MERLDKFESLEKKVESLEIKLDTLKTFITAKTYL